MTKVNRKPTNKAAQILEAAEALGVNSNYFFESTFKRYMVQIQILDELEKSIQELGTTVEKEYVKGRPNICINPTIAEFNKTSTAANNTVGTLMTILKNASADKQDAPKMAQIMAALNE